MHACRVWFGVLWCCVAAATSAAPMLTADQARSDLRILKRALVTLHPGLYRNATPAQIDAAFTAADAEVAQGAERAQMFLLASKLAAAVRCGHTWASPYNQSQAVRDEVFARADKLPFTLRVVEGRFLITGSMLPELKVGSEVLGIDGRDAAQIAAALMPYLRADGSADGKRLSQLDSGRNGGAMDRLFPLRFAPQDGRYQLRLHEAAGQAPRSLSVPAVREAARDAAGLKPEPDDWRFDIDGDTARLTLPSFAFWNSRFDARGFLARSFAELRAAQTPFLVIDIRRNEGGDDALGQALLAYLLREPFTIAGGRRESAYERVPYILARYLDTWDFGFFDRTGQARRGSGRNWLLSDSEAQRIEPTAMPYDGRSVLLVGPQNSSAGFVLARDMQRSQAAVLVGQPTGGSQRGLNGGQLAWITLPASGVAVDIPLVAHFADGDPPDTGVMPDVVVPQRFDDAAAGVDTDLEAARKLIGGWRR